MDRVFADVRTESSNADWSESLHDIMGRDRDAGRLTAVEITAIRGTPSSDFELRIVCVGSQGHRPGVSAYLSESRAARLVASLMEDMGIDVPVDIQSRMR
jgi:hypothetical protein